jgi:hypothetical protein
MSQKKMPQLTVTAAALPPLDALPTNYEFLHLLNLTTPMRSDAQCISIGTGSWIFRRSFGQERRVINQFIYGCSIFKWCYLPDFLLITSRAKL